MALDQGSNLSVRFGKGEMLKFVWRYPTGFSPLTLPSPPLGERVGVRGDFPLIDFQPNAILRKSVFDFCLWTEISDTHP